MKPMSRYLPIVVLATAIVLLHAATAEFLEGDFSYTVSNDRATITRYTGPGGDISFPAILGGYPVIRIGGPMDFLKIPRVFDSHIEISSVTIPASVTTINDPVNLFRNTIVKVQEGNSSFSSLDGVLFNKEQTVLLRYPLVITGHYTIPDGVTTIAPRAFSGATLTSVTMPASVTTIEDSAFAGCTSLSSVTIPNSVTNIGKFTFAGCTSLSSVTIPDSVTSIEDGVFFNCTSLTNTSIGNGLTSIGVAPFANCTSLATITVAHGNQAFSSIDGVLFNKDRTSLVQYPKGRSGAYKVPAGVTTIAPMALQGATLASVTIPNSVTNIGRAAFNFCTSLTSVTIPDSVTSIGHDAFHNCTSLTSVTIPDSVTCIGHEAFRICTALKSVFFYGPPPQYGERVFDGTPATIYYFPDHADQWPDIFAGRPTSLWQQ